MIDKLRILFPYFREHFRSLIAGGAIIFLVALLILPTPFITKYILDTLIPSRNLKLLIISILLVSCIHVTISFLRYFQSVLFYKINNKIIYSLRVNLLKKLNMVSLNILEKNGTGYYLSRINDDTNRLRSLFVGTFVETSKDILTFIICLIAIFSINWRLAVIVCFILPFFLISSIIYSKKIRNASSTYYENNSRNNKQLEESISCIKLIKLFSMFNYNVNKYQKTSEINLKSNILFGKTNLRNLFFSGLFTGFLPIISIGYGAYEVIEGNFSIGSLIAFNTFSGYLFGPANRLIQVNGNFQAALVALNRINELFNLPMEEFSNNHLIHTFKCLEIKNLTFSYQENNNILKDVNITIRKGDKVGIVGNSGNGKTTILNILSSLYEIKEGQFLINNKKMSHSQLVSFRNSIAFVEQEPFLFDDTIFNNIKFGNSNSSEEDLYSVAQLAYVNEFVEKLPNKYYTNVGYKGCNLSIGQKQRIAIARALLKKPQILILDEATSSIDNFSEKYIIETINNLPKDMAVVMVSHRISTIQNCDKILVLDKGMIKEEGKHDELIRRKGLYFELNRVFKSD